MTDLSAHGRVQPASGINASGNCSFHLPHVELRLSGGLTCFCSAKPVVSFCLERRDVGDHTYRAVHI